LPQRRIGRCQEGRERQDHSEDKGKSGKVSFKGKTKDNVSLEGTIDCHQVMRGEG
jgi:hypothetical protein